MKNSFNRTSEIRNSEDLKTKNLNHEAHEEKNKNGLKGCK
jgi:hypothetical protein